MLVFDTRCGFHNPESMEKTVESAPFASAYFCRGVLPHDLMFEQLIKRAEPLMDFSDYLEKQDGE